MSDQKQKYGNDNLGMVLPIDIKPRNVDGENRKYPQVKKATQVEDITISAIL